MAFCDDGEVAPASLDPGSLSRMPNGRLRWARDPQLWQQLGQMVQSASLVHIHGLWREHSSIAAKLCRRFAIPYVVSAHGMLEPWALNNGKWKKRLYLAAVEQKVLQGAAGLRALTKDEVSDYRNLGLRNPVEVLPNGIDLPNKTSPALFLEAYPHLTGKRLIVFLGRIHKKKGIDILCHAWAQISREFPEAHLVIAGPGEDQTLNDLIGLVRDLQMENRITFTGMLRGELKWAALAASSVFVLPSHSEGFSVAIQEALGSGLPVIISTACHFPEILKVDCGWEIEPEKSQLTGVLIQALKADQETLSEMGARGRKLMANSFTWPKVGERAADIFEQWCGASSRRIMQPTL